MDRNENECMLLYKPYTGTFVECDIYSNVLVIYKIQLNSYVSLNLDMNYHWDIDSLIARISVMSFLLLAKWIAHS
jgi:hypothetical protein